MNSELTAVLSALEAMSKQQAEQGQTLTALCSHQSNLSSQLQVTQGTLNEVLKALSREPSGESLKETMAELLRPLNDNLKGLVASFNKLSEISTSLSDQLPPPRSTSKSTP